MNWPSSPFEENKSVLEYLKEDYIQPEAVAEFGLEKCEEHFQMLIHWLCHPPALTTLRLNMDVNVELAIEEVVKNTSKNGHNFHIAVHPSLPDVLIIRSIKESPDFSVLPRGKQVVVGLQCGEAVLRGAHVYATGILGAPQSLSVEDDVSIYADLDGKCLRGQIKPFCGRKVFVGNGKSLVTRDLLFKSLQLGGVAVKVVEPISDCPSSETLQVGVLQNLPSIVCSHVLQPQPGHWVIDMCASPGGKTTHIGNLMKDQGTVVALDKTLTRMNKLKETVAASHLTCIHCFVFDATKSVDETKTPREADALRKIEKESLLEELLFPPYPPELFDRVLLDAPCSGLGRRPQLSNQMTVKELQSYPALQKKLFSAGYRLLRVGGTLVYSTCTLTLAENEGLVKWALDSFPTLELTEQVPYLGGPGSSGRNLSLANRMKLQRFEVSPDKENSVNCDTIGFFIAKFLKT